MTTILSLQDNLLRLEHGDLFEEREFTATDREELETCAHSYRDALNHLGGGADQHLVTGRRLYRWLDGQSWLQSVRELSPTPPWLLEIRISQQNPGAEEFALFNAPWELLADDKGHLAADPALRFSPLRRLGRREKPPEASPYRLALMFMAASPAGQTALSYEAEEDAILRAAERVDLSVEESGNLRQLGNLARDEAEIRPPGGKLERRAPDVVHVSCHGGFVKRTPVLFLEDGTGSADPVSAADLLAESILLESGLLFVSACHSADTLPLYWLGRAGEEENGLISSPPSFDSAQDKPNPPREEATVCNGGRVADALAVQLLRGGFRAVLGWGGTISDAEATDFARHLYQRLADGLELEKVLAEARFALLNKHAASRDWHLARLFLGPHGGGALVRGSKARHLLHFEHGAQAFLSETTKQVEVARRGEFVGRRRYLQKILREFRKPRHGGVLIHGMGGQGKSSLAARVADRLPRHKVVLVYGDYRAQDVLAAFERAKLGRAVSDILHAYEKNVRGEPEYLTDALQELLAGPCAQDVPVLLVIDDLEQALEAVPGGLHRPNASARPMLRTVIESFRVLFGESRLLLTSRYRFSVANAGGEELTETLLQVHLPPMDEFERRKQVRSRNRSLAGETLVEEDPQRTARCLRLAGGNPGLQDLLYRLSRRDPAACDVTLEAVENWLAGGDLAGESDADVREVLEGLALDGIYAGLSETERNLLRAASLFEVPVPLEVLEANAVPPTAV